MTAERVRSEQGLRVGASASGRGAHPYPYPYRVVPSLVRRFATSLAARGFTQQVD